MIWFLCYLHCTCLPLVLPANPLQYIATVLHYLLQHSADEGQGLLLYTIIYVFTLIYEYIQLFMLFSCECVYVQTYWDVSFDDVHRTKNAPTMTIVRHSEHERQHQPQEALPYIPEVSVKERLRVGTPTIRTNPTKIHWISIILILVTNDESSRLVDQPSYHIHGKLSKRNSLFCNFCSLW